MKKKANWEELHFDFLLKYKDKKFAWGKWDCIKFVNAYLKAISGTDVLKGAKDLKKWNTESDAKRSIKDYGKTLSGAIHRRVTEKGMVEIPKKNFGFISKGDLICFKEETELAGISDGHNILGPGEDGMRIKQISSCEIVRVWRING